MDAVFKFIDQVIHSIPANLLRAVQLGAIVLWAGLAVIVALYSWSTGSESAEVISTERMHADISAKAHREKLLKERPDVIVSEILEQEEKEWPAVRPGLAPSAALPEEGESFPPFLGEDRSVVFPRTAPADTVAQDRDSEPVIRYRPEEKEIPVFIPEKGTKQQENDSELKLLPLE